MAITNIFGRDFYQGLDADMAACVPRVDGALFWATDTLVLYCWSGAAWNTVGAGIGGNVATDAIWDAKGDLAAATGANTAVKVTVGTDGKYLKADSGAAAGVSWDTPAGNVATDAIWDAAGDLAVGSGANTAAKLSIGSAYQVFAVNSGATAPEWTGAIGCCVKRANALSISNATPTAITWDSEVRDDGGCWEAGNPTRLVAPIAGWYAISAFAWWDADNDGGRRLYITESGAGATVGRQSSPSSTAHNDVTNHVSAIYYLTAAQYFVVYADQNAGGSLNIKVGAMAQMARIR